MQRMMLTICLMLMLLVSGCATQRYGRMTTLVDSEAESLDCEHIDIEIDKCNAFIREVNAHAGKFTGKDVISFLGDFGIGDRWEINDATRSATKRIAQLQKLRVKKNCGERRKSSSSSYSRDRREEPGWDDKDTQTDGYGRPRQ